MPVTAFLSRSVEKRTLVARSAEALFVGELGRSASSTAEEVEGAWCADGSEKILLPELLWLCMPVPALLVGASAARAPSSSTCDECRLRMLGELGLDEPLALVMLGRGVRRRGGS